MYVLALDVGTSSLKATIIDADCCIKLSKSIVYPTISTTPEFCEQNPHLWWSAVVDICAEFSATRPDIVSRIDAVAVCGHMLGCVCVDNDGEPVRNALIHSDTRSSKQRDRISKDIGVENLYKYTGNILSAQSTLAKILWLKENEYENYKKTANFLQSKDYITSKLTGNINCSDYSDASHSQLINLNTKEYLHDVFNELNLDISKFPVLYNGTDIVGNVTDKAAGLLGIKSGIPVIAGAGDGVCANLGAGISSVNELYCSLGTTAWIAYNSAEPVLDNDMRVFDIIDISGQAFSVFGTVQSAGKCVTWAQKLFDIKDIDKFNKTAEKAPSGSDGLIFLPYLDGERSPIYDDNARGMFFGIDSTFGKPHFLRSVYEGVANALNHILCVHRERIDIREMRIIGGGVKSKLWMQIISDVCNADLLANYSDSSSLTSVGVALAAFVALGVYPSINEAAKIIKIQEKTEPIIRNRKIYDKIFDKYVQLYTRNKDLFVV